MDMEQCLPHPLLTKIRWPQSLRPGSIEPIGASTGSSLTKSAAYTSETMFFIARSRKDGPNLQISWRKLWRRGEANFIVLTFGCEDNVSDKAFRPRVAARKRHSRAEISGRRAPVMLKIAPAVKHKRWIVF
jgi:hypothetical protein